MNRTWDMLAVVVVTIALVVIAWRLAGYFRDQHVLKRRQYLERKAWRLLDELEGNVWEGDFSDIAKLDRAQAVLRLLRNSFNQEDPEVPRDVWNRLGRLTDRFESIERIHQKAWST